MSFYRNFLIISLFLGPGMGISYGLGNPEFNPSQHLTDLLVLEALAIGIVYIILRRLPTDKRFRNKILTKVAHQMQTSRNKMLGIAERVSNKFKKRFGDLGFYMALATMAFAYGVFVAAIVAYFLKVKLSRAMISITVGMGLSIVFWWHLAIGAIPFVTPMMVFVSTTGLTVGFLIYGWFRENKIIERIAHNITRRQLT